MKHAPNPRRAELRALSMELRPSVKMGMFASVNEALVAHYSGLTGRSTWHTFHDWRATGRPVKKGETGFPIWGTPRAITGAAVTMTDLTAVMVATGQVSTDDLAPEFFPVCYLFHDGQVQGAPDEHQPDLLEGAQP